MLTAAVNAHFLTFAHLKYCLAYQKNRDGNLREIAVFYQQMVLEAHGMAAAAFLKSWPKM